ncbi:hypothetical protein [Marinibacterium sp. SX1]|uniref:hypothetical protein n=1 Tax=Marinibacterium sp. SX1 TaxID=3388424 RepID=UPI003D173E9A
MKALRRIVLHVGPEKCGSTTIQGALGMDPAAPGPMADRVRGVLLDPYALVFLESDSPAENVVADLHGLIAAHGRDDSNRLLVLSHEMIFKSPRLLGVLAAIAGEHADEVVALACLRRQSDLVISGFGQWHFRSAERLRAAGAVIEAQGIEPGLFLAVERHLAAALLDGWQVARQPSGHFYADWAAGLAERAGVMRAVGGRLAVAALPPRGQEARFLPEVLGRIGLAMPPAGVGSEVGTEAAPGTEQDTGLKTGPRIGPKIRRNRSFHPAVIEATATAVLAGLPMPGPHEANHFFRDASRRWAAANRPSPDLSFLARLAARVDAHFAEGNAAVTAEWGLDPACLAPAGPVGAGTLAGLLAEEADRRRAAGRRPDLDAARAIAADWAALRDRNPA